MGICIGVCFVRVVDALGCREVFTYIDGKYCSIISYHVKCRRKNSWMHCTYDIHIVSLYTINLVSIQLTIDKVYRYQYVQIKTLHISIHKVNRYRLCSSINDNITYIR